MPRLFRSADLDLDAICLARGEWARVKEWAFESIRVVVLNTDGSESNIFKQYRIPHNEVFYYSELDYALNRLVNARFVQSEAKADVEALNAEVKHIYEGLTEANKLEKLAAEYLRKVALQAVIAGQELDNGLQVQMRNKVGYNPQKVVRWLADHQPGLLTIDESKFAKLTKGMDADTRAALEIHDYQEPFITIPTKLE